MHVVLVHHARLTLHSTFFHQQPSSVVTSSKQACEKEEFSEKVKRVWTEVKSPVATVERL